MKGGGIVSSVAGQSGCWECGLDGKENVTLSKSAKDVKRFEQQGNSRLTAVDGELKY